MQRRAFVGFVGGFCIGLPGCLAKEADNNPQNENQTTNGRNGSTQEDETISSESRKEDNEENDDTATCQGSIDIEVFVPDDVPDDAGLLSTKVEPAKNAEHLKNALREAESEYDGETVDGSEEYIFTYNVNRDEVDDEEKELLSSIQYVSHDSTIYLIRTSENAC